MTIFFDGIGHTNYITSVGLKHKMSLLRGFNKYIITGYPKSLLLFLRSRAGKTMFVDLLLDKRLFKNFGMKLPKNYFNKGSEKNLIINYSMMGNYFLNIHSYTFIVCNLSSNVYNLYFHILLCQISIDKIIYNKKFILIA